MEFDEVIKNRKSVRNFKDKKVDWRDLIYAIEATLNTPYAGNFANNRFIILESGGQIKKIAEYCNQPWIGDAKAIIVVTANDVRLEDVYGDRGRIYSKQQAGAAIQTLLLKLTDLGLASCWVGAFSDSLIRTMLNIPRLIQIEAIIAIGYEREVKGFGHPLRKFEPDNVIYWDGWRGRRRQDMYPEPRDPMSIEYYRKERAELRDF